jgi:signal recognition particle receptor subunit beta
VAVVDFEERQVTLKLVYYGPPLSGKTTNLRYIYRCVDELNRGRLMTLNTRDDRTLFFDLLPIFFKASGLSFRVKVYTVPGQPLHATTREVVLSGSDGIAFVADSSASAMEANEQAYRDLVANMEKLGLHRDKVPIVIQYNKRDLPKTIPEDELHRLGGGGAQSLVPAAAIHGEGVLETFKALLDASFTAMDRNISIRETFNIGRDDFLAAISEHLSPPRSV